MLLSDVVDRLVLRDLHTGAHVTLTMQEEGEGTREVFTAAGETKRGGKMPKVVISRTNVLVCPEEGDKHKVNSSNNMCGT